VPSQSTHLDEFGRVSIVDTTMRVIVLDLDDTLFPEIQYVESGFSSVGRWLIDLRVRNLLDPFVELSSAEAFAVRCMELHVAGVRGDVFDRMVGALGVDGQSVHRLLSNQELVNEMVKVYRYHRPSIALHADAVALFKRSRASGDCRIGVITNGLAAVQRLKVEALELEKWCDYIIYCEELGVQKPSEIPYRHMMKLCGHGYDGGDFIYIGDHAVKDFVGARGCGWKTARIVRENGLHGHVVAPVGVDADVVVTSLNLV
jgi:putative hydrolase of the HAD superfamily